jgi:hypothetical protein
MEAGKFSFKFSRQTQKNLVGSSKYAYFSTSVLAYTETFIAKTEILSAKTETFLANTE